MTEAFKLNVSKKKYEFGKCPVCSKKWGYKHKGKLYSHLIGLEDPMIYDGVNWWTCPFCDSRWSRWTGELEYDGWEGLL